MKDARMTSFMDKLPAAERRLAGRLRKTIAHADKAVSEKPGAIMGAHDALCYNQEGVMKYGLARTKSGYTFHSMVMYANSDVLAFAKDRLKGVKVQKGCVNISSLEDFDFAAFEEMLALSAAKDFSPVIAHYKKRERK